MGNSTPSSRRRDGRNAFAPLVNPEDACPYSKTSWYYKFYYPDFLDGWKEAEAEFEASRRNEKEDIEPCCDYCLKLREEVDELKEELQFLRRDLDLHTGDYDEDYG